MAARHSGCDAILIATPEYGHSLPGELKNGIDWVIGTSELYQRVVAITAAVGGAGRGTMGLGALRRALDGLSAVVVGGRPIVRGPSFDDEIANLLREIADAVANANAGDARLPETGSPRRRPFAAVRLDWGDG